MNEFSIEISDGQRDLPLCREAAEDAARQMGFTGDDLGDIVCAVFEACVNAFTHGSKGATGPVNLQIRTYPDRFEAVVKDTGTGFSCPVDTPIPSYTSPRGRGIPLMRAFMDDVSFEHNDGCKVTLARYLHRKT